jgi:phosphate acetyltransferase
LAVQQRFFRSNHARQATFTSLENDCAFDATRYLTAMRFIGNIIEKLQRHPKRIVFPEGTEPCVLQAARQFYSLRMGAPILLGDGAKIQAMAQDLNVSLEGIRIINPGESDDLENFARRFAALRRYKGLQSPEAREAIMQPNFFGAMMLAMHQADAMVSGANHTTGSVLRPLFQIVKMAPQTATVSSCMVMEVEDSQFGEKGVLFMADCGVIPEPTVDQLADVAVSTAQLARQLLGVRPRVAFLSFSTKGSARHPIIGRIQAATALAQKKAAEKNLEADFDGELQADAAIVPDIALRKAPDSKVGGHANVLIFPDLNSGNIASRLIRHIAHANAYGQILIGLDRPAADVARGSNAHDVLGVAAIVGVQATDYEKLYPGAGGRLPGETEFLSSQQKHQTPPPIGART